MHSNGTEKQGYDPLHDGPELGQHHPNQTEQQNEVIHTDKVKDFLGFREPLQRVAAGLVTLLLLVIVTLGLRIFTGNKSAAVNLSGVSNGILITPTSTLSGPIPVIDEVVEVAYSGGIPRLAQIHTNLPTRPREEIEKYTVQAGDTIYGIAEKFGLKPETILWGNYYTLLDNPSFLQPEEILNILPVDGVLHKWSAGEGLNGVAGYYNIKPEEIVNYPANHLDPNTIGDFANPNIKPDTWLIIPGGKREFINWSAPRITRDDPSVAAVLGGGVCGSVDGGAVGIGYFIWPTNNHFLSGFDYSPATNHYGIDLDGETGDPIYASDNGVVVYAGWNDYGYGNMVVIDHGGGWQSLYGHLSQIGVECGANVYQGQVIGLMGSTGKSTGSHLHFELMSGDTKVNPFSYLPAP